MDPQQQPWPQQDQQLIRQAKKARYNQQPLKTAGQKSAGQSRPFNQQQHLSKYGSGQLSAEINQQERRFLQAQQQRQKWINRSLSSSPSQPESDTESRQGKDYPQDRDEEQDQDEGQDQDEEQDQDEGHNYYGTWQK